MKNVEIYEKIAPKYDFSTKIISMGMEYIWRKIFVKKIKKYIKNGILLDVGSATGEMAKSLDFEKMYLLDPSKKMNDIAQKKFKDKNVTFVCDFAESCVIPQKVDLITAFMAVRNFDCLQEGIKNLDKYLKKGGYFAVVEMTKNKTFFSAFVEFYMSKIVPLIGGMLTREYQSYKKFDKMVKNIEDEDIIRCFDGYRVVEHQKLFLSIASLIILEKNG